MYTQLLLPRSKVLAAFWLPAIFFLALGLRFLYVFVLGSQNPLEGDASGYFSTVQQMIERNVYAYGQSEPNARVTPGFPLFAYIILSTFSMRLDALLWAQIIVGAATVLPAYAYIRAITNHGWGLLAGLFVAIYPPFIYGTGILITETLFIFFLACFFLSWQWMVERTHLTTVSLSGFTLTLTILTRPTMFPVLAVAFIYFAWNARMRRWLLPYLIVTACCFLPWVLRNALVLGEFTLLASDSGNALLAGAYPYFREDVNYREMASLGLSQTAYGIRVIVNGFIERPLEFLGWFSFGKLYYTFRSMWVSSTLNFPQFYMYAGVLLHYLTLLLSLFALPLLIWRRSFLAVSFTAMLMFQLMFIPTVRYGAPFMLLMTFMVCQAAFLVNSRYNPKILSNNRFSPSTKP
ncbi:4-amino-4-deoxy-L-arabinose transferase-like glycosyltransferase [Paenibacillus shirakamiensis]|uniref:4-amino-4-deoxy-L-arabinose transferase-like glycosyltransferase n=1 Tax=Paenibacillus shirakamiensis TaxID=1265935 RepID=A0ABS4JLF7_9BACL|nr:glycosyltransferase family 39 protein [Paenibacillus shirakamiensis]MBP2001925.1 4-amino-4-deoxy-L-arabinose transferase-like glycosyltransferase [Paenibacillus shirakamiensis]